MSKNFNNQLIDDDFCIVSTYTRAQAIDDGVLLDVTRMAQEAGFRFPVAMTHAAWCDCVAVPDTAIGQDETGRLWDVLNMMRYAARGESTSEIRFSVLVVQAENEQREIQLKALCHPGDNAEPVLTIMLPDED